MYVKYNLVFKMNEVVRHFVKADQEATTELHTEKSRFVKCLLIKYKCLLVIVLALILLFFLVKKYLIDEEMAANIKTFINSHIKNQTINI